MQKFGRVAFFFLVALALLAQVQGARAQDQGVTDDEVNEIARDIYCPVCENTPLDVCATQACADWRELIRTKLAEGQSPQEIFEYFARQYGDGVLANPPQRGISLVILWVLPVVLLLVGLFFFGRIMRNLRVGDGVPESVSPSGNVAASPTPLAGPSRAAPDDYQARVEEELRRGK